MDPSHWSIQFKYEKNGNHNEPGHYILCIPFEADWGKHIKHGNRLDLQFGRTLFDQAIQEKENVFDGMTINQMNSRRHESLEGTYYDDHLSRDDFFDNRGKFSNPFSLIKPPTIVIDFERAFKSYNDKLEKRELEEWVEKETEETDHRDEGCPHM